MERDPAVIEVFTSPTCPHCPYALKVARSISKEFGHGVKVYETNIEKKHGKRRAKKFSVMSFPTVIVSGPAIFQPLGHQGVPSKNVLRKYVTRALGQKKVESSSSLLDTLRFYFFS